jgi:hypothetical protein
MYITTIIFHGYQVMGSVLPILPTAKVKTQRIQHKYHAMHKFPNLFQYIMLNGGQMQ